MSPIFPYDDDARKKTHEIVDRLFDHVQNVSSRPVVRWSEPQELAAGGTKHHSELLAPFGLDARDPAFWQGGLGVIERMIAELEGLS